ncbi:FGGY family carbohydrate kinase, partial [Salmonella enterica]|uniref:FGGY family carbohydrate kinase n=1 Tax=Salmonella enterica TaxID=28901 RepID=UPI003CEE0384
MDFGTSGVKLVVVDQQGRHRSSHREDNPTAHPPSASGDVMTERDPEHWWDAFRAVIAAAVTRPGLAERVVAIGLTGQMQ